jgi:hypothetical protein
MQEYFPKPHFDLVRKEFDTHLLIKSSDPAFREVLKDAEFFFINKDLVDVPIVEKEIKALLSGIKPTWRNIFSQIAETFEENVFGIEKIGW